MSNYIRTRIGKIGVTSKRKGFYYLRDEILWGEVLTWLRIYGLDSQKP
jgi:hypothetical protein